MHDSQRVNVFTIVTDKGSHDKLHILVLTYSGEKLAVLGQISL